MKKFKVVVDNVARVFEEHTYIVEADDEDDAIEKNDEILSEKIVEHGYLYQNGKTIEYTKKIVTMKRNEKQWYWKMRLSLKNK